MCERSLSAREVVLRMEDKDWIIRELMAERDAYKAMAEVKDELSENVMLLNMQEGVIRAMEDRDTRLIARLRHEKHELELRVKELEND